MRFVVVLLGLLGICSPAHAQEFLTPQSTDAAGDWLDALPRAELPVIQPNLLGSMVKPTPGAKQPFHDLFTPRHLLQPCSGEMNQVCPEALDAVLAAARRPPGNEDSPSYGGASLDGLRRSFVTGLAGASTQQAGQTPPAPEHTGFKALLFETASDFNAFPRRPSTWVILAIGGAAAAIAHPYDVRVTSHLVESNAAGNFFIAGKYVGSDYVQIGAAIGLYGVGRYLLPHAEGQPKSNKVSHLGFDLLRALLVTEALTQGIKVAVQRARPTGECCSFPSGHASATFATAAVLERHLGYRGAVPTFLIASYVAASRLHDNRHYLSDVLFGGALGVASGWTVVGRHGRSNYAVVPVPLPGGMMVRVTREP
jgi:membrane-associated phospholipid phosphatase